MASSPKSDASTLSSSWWSPDEQGFSYSSSIASDDYEHEDDYDYDRDCGCGRGRDCGLYSYYNYDPDYDDDSDFDDACGCGCDCGDGCDCGCKCRHGCDYYYKFDGGYDYYGYYLGFDTHPQLIDLTTARRYFASRVPFRSDGNPRGKFPRKPLPWPARKLSAVQSYEQEADEYRIRLWQWELDQKRKRQQHHDPSSMVECIPDDPGDPVSQTTQDNIVSKESNTTKHGRHDGPTIKKVDKKRARKEKTRVQKIRDKNKPRFENPHYLLALDAMHRKKGCQKVWVGCPICNKIEAEWDGVMKNKSRDLATRRQDGLLEAKDDCLALDIFTDDRRAFHDCDCGSCFLSSTIDPDYDHAHIEMRHVVDYVDSLGWEAFRVRYVDSIGRGKRKVKEGQGLDAVQEKEEVEVSDVSISIQEGTEDTNNTNLSRSADSDTLSEEWDILGDDSIDGCAIQDEVGLDTAEPGKETNNRATDIDTQRPRWNTSWLLGRWLG